MKSYTSDSSIQSKPIPPIIVKSIQSKFGIKASSRLEKPSTPQHSTKLPFLTFTSEEPTQIRRILYHKPEVSAKAWIVLDGSNGMPIDGSNENDLREVASLTKIMTCIVVIQECIRLKKSFEEMVEVSVTAAGMDGTSAGLRNGDSLRIWDLLHGLMLPSGNDAAIALAEYFGFILSGSSPVSAFINKMNSFARQLKMYDTVFRNPHGMSTSINISTAKNIATLAMYALKIPIFSKIVNTYNYTCSIYNKGETKCTTWINTNRLLRKGFNGVKTGYTPAAGPCLCSYIEQRNKKLLIVMLNTKNMQSRWTEAVKIWKWANAHILQLKKY